MREEHNVISEPREYRHTPITLMLRYNVMESQLLAPLRANYVTAVAAAHSHPSADIKEAMPKINDLYYSVMAMIPYTTGGKDQTEMLTEERVKALERYAKAFQKKPIDLKTAEVMREK